MRDFHFITPINFLRVLFLIITFLFQSALEGQVRQKNNDDVCVDSAGVMRWKHSHDEVKLFGVNYTTPFAYAYRAQKKLGLSLKQSIDLDVAQMVRLGFDAFRVHVWEKEITDSAGNIIENEHLDLLDYLLWKLKKAGIKTILTPIAWWGNGWPEADEVTHGFSQPYSKKELITNPTARAAQRNYLKQFILHQDKYTKLSYKEDPSIIAMEIINEPFHPEDTSLVVDYIDEMAAAMRDAGFDKPIFYNISQNWNDEQAQAVCNANIQGVSFQWYPTDLVHNSMVKGNFLPNVEHYKIPSENLSGYKNKTKMVYEFEAADVGGWYMYPAMARSFREAGMQFATMFSYEPTQIAWSNTEYPTHYLNLLYTPSKAISLMIAGYAFHQLPMNQSYGDYPENNRFGDFRVTYFDDLSIANGDTCYYYSYTNDESPKHAAALKHIAGCGNSPLVDYNGTGAYFLDKIKDEVWRLEIYPDALWLTDPFQPTSLSREVAKLFWNEREMKLRLPLLKNKFLVQTMKEGKLTSFEAESSRFRVRPGIYLISQKKIAEKVSKKYLSANSFLQGLFIPKNKTDVYVVERTAKHQSVEKPVVFKFDVAAKDKITSVQLFIKKFGWKNFIQHEMRKGNGFEYSFTDSSRHLSAGEWQYCVTVTVDKKNTTFPGMLEQNPNQWDFKIESPRQITLHKEKENVNLFSPSVDRANILFPHFTSSLQYQISYGAGKNGAAASLIATVHTAQSNTIPFGFQFAVDDKTELLDDAYTTLVVSGRSLQGTGDSCKINLLMRNGEVFSSNLFLSSEWSEVHLPITTFVKGEAVVLPNAYPLFLPKVFVSRGSESIIEVTKLSALQFVCGNQKKSYAFELESMYLITNTASQK